MGYREGYWARSLSWRGRCLCLGGADVFGLGSYLEDGVKVGFVGLAVEGLFFTVEYLKFEFGMDCSSGT